MGFRFRKSFKIAPGVRVNLGKKSVGISAGVKGARVSVNSSGRVTKSVGIPGTGISYVKSEKIGGSTSNHADESNIPEENKYVSRPDLPPVNPQPDKEQNKKKGCGCLVYVILGLLIIGLFNSCFGGKDESLQDENSKTVQTIAVESIEPAQEPVNSLTVGEEQYIYHVVLPENADLGGWDYTATSSDPNFMEAKAVGVVDPLRIQVTVTGKAAGTATYTLTDAEGNAVLTSETITVTDPEAEAAAQAAAEEAAAEQEAAQEPSSPTVYITPTGARYHISAKCAGDNAIETTLDEATSQGYTPCGRCA